MSDDRPTLTPWRLAGLAAGVVAAAAVVLAPSELQHFGAYGSRPARAAAVAVLMAVWWLTEALPAAVTACAPLVLFPLLGVSGRGPAADLRAAASPFADAYLVLFLGGMAVGAAMEAWGLHRRVALGIMRAVGTSPRRLLVGVLVATASVSLWISNTATAVMMLPIAMALVAQLEASAGRRLDHFGGAVMLAVAYGANLGGVGTKIGTATNSIFCGFVARELGVEIGFLRYMAAATPFVALMVPLAYAALWRTARLDGLEAAQGRDAVARELAALGPVSREERKVALVFAVAAVLWIFGDPLRSVIAPHVPAPWPGWRYLGKHHEAAVATLAALALAAWGALPARALRRVPWGCLVLLGGSFAMAAGVEESGLSRWLAGRMAGVASLPPVAQAALASGAAVALSAVASNTATINVLLHVLPRSVPVLAAAAMGASCDFMLPAGTPPNAIVFGSGRVRLPVMIRTGLALDLAAVALLTAYAAVWLRAVL